jgi:hypothetical protein
MRGHADTLPQHMAGTVRDGGHDTLQSRAGWLVTQYMVALAEGIRGLTKRHGSGTRLSSDLEVLGLA